MNRSQKALNALIALDTAGVAPVITTGQELREVLEALATIQDRDDARDPEDLGPNAEAIVGMADALVEVAVIIGGSAPANRVENADALLEDIASVIERVRLPAPNDNTVTYPSHARMAYFGRTGRLIDL